MLILAFISTNGQMQPTSLATFFLFVLLRIMPIVRQLNGARAHKQFQGPLAAMRLLQAIAKKLTLTRWESPVFPIAASY